jgi:hypothetical protein|tara:strand:- start:299 stop:685 length:387 start_codon:yes stop_codon:yes gene_type:complete
MKTPTLLITLAILLIFSSSSYAEWTKVSESLNDEDTYYLDFEKIKFNDKYVFWWQLSNYLKPTTDGFFSAKSYIQGDCKKLWIKILSSTSHKLPMGGGNGTNYIISDKWFYPPSNSSIEFILKLVCAR